MSLKHKHHAQQRTNQHVMHNSPTQGTPIHTVALQFQNYDQWAVVLVDNTLHTDTQHSSIPAHFSFTQSLAKTGDVELFGDMTPPHTLQFSWIQSLTSYKQGRIWLTSVAWIKISCTLFVPRIWQYFRLTWSVTLTDDVGLKVTQHTNTFYHDTLIGYDRWWGTDRSQDAALQHTLSCHIDGLWQVMRDGQIIWCSTPTHFVMLHWLAMTGDEGRTDHMMQHTNTLCHVTLIGYDRWWGMDRLHDAAHQHTLYIDTFSDWQVMWDWCITWHGAPARTLAWRV